MSASPSRYTANSGWIPGDELQIRSVRVALERILEHPYFSRSRRCTDLLHYVVEKSLSGEYELKERTLGIEVFGRSPDYDTSTDPIVRNTAHDVRKRLAQYWCEPGHENELRIDLLPGSYVPRFYPPERSSARNEESEKDAPARLNSTVALGPARQRTGWLAYALLALLCIGTTTAVAALRPWQTVTAVDKFWSPLLKQADTTVVVSVGEPVMYALENGIGTPPPGNRPPWNVIGMNDILVFAKVTSYLGLQGKISHVQGQSATTLDDLKRGPTVFIGAFDNKWSIKLTQGLYYRLNPYPQGSGSIYDTSNGHEWTYTPHSQDYAIVARFQDPTTHQLVMIGAGIGEPGNSAAGDFITNPELLQAAMKKIGDNLSHGNVELVLSTKITSGIVGPPEVVASHVW